MKYRLPEGCCALSYAGRQVAVTADGTVELDVPEIAELQAHGLAPVSDAPAETGADASGKRPATR